MSNRRLTTDLPFEQQPLSEQLRVIGEAWVDVQAAWTALDEAKTTTLERLKSRVIEENPGTPDNAATRLAKCSAGWGDYLKRMSDLNRKRLDLKLKMDVIEMRHREQQSREANARSERRL